MKKWVVLVIIAFLVGSAMVAVGVIVQRYELFYNEGFDFGSYDV